MYMRERGRLKVELLKDIGITVIDFDLRGGWETAWWGVL